MAAELFTIATQPKPGLERLRKSLSLFGVPITTLGKDEPGYWGHCWRWKTFIRAVKASRADTVIHCDGYDTVCLGPLTDLLTKFASLGHPIVFSSELQEHSEFGPALQPGLMIAEREALARVFDDQLLHDFFPDHFNDQCQLQAIHSWHPGWFKLDTESHLFYTLNRYSLNLLERDGRLLNPHTGIAPSFVHAPNNWDLANVEQWLAKANSA